MNQQTHNVVNKRSVQSVDENSIFYKLKNLRDLVENTVYKVTVPEITIYSEAELTYVGINIGDIKNPTNVLERVTTVYIPLKKILEIWSDGHAVQVQPDVSVIMGQHIEKYLSAWVEMIQSTRLKHIIPFDYLISLAEFYDMIKPYKESREKTQKQSGDLSAILEEFLSGNISPENVEDFNYTDFFKQASVSRK